MHSDGFIAVLVFGILSTILGISLVVGVHLDRASCAAKTAQIGRPSRYSLLGGCRLEVAPGVWLPLDLYRVEERRP